MAKINTKKQNQTIIASNTMSDTISAIPTWLSNINLNIAIIALTGFLLYANTLFHDYTQDDAIVIYDNMYTTTGVSGISGILGKDTFYGFFKEEGKAGLVSGGRYRPFTLVMFAIENQIFGSVKKDVAGKPVVDKNGNTVLEYSKFVGHFFNVFWYIITCIVLYLLLLRLLKSEGDDVANVVAFAATILFTVHPIHTEAVANIKGRDEIIALLGSISALYFSFKAYDEKKPIWSIVAAIVFFIALMSKENAIAFFAIAPLAYWFFTKEDIPTIIKQSTPFFACSILFLAVRTAVIGWQFGGTPPMELMNNPFLKLVNNEYVSFSANEKLGTIVYTLGKYIQLLFAPVTLTHDYYPRHIDIMSLGNIASLASLLIYLGLAYYAFKSLKTKSVVGFGVIFFLGTMLLVSNLLFAIGTNMSERFMFMPSVGFCLAIAYLLYRYVKNVNVVLGIVGILTLLFSIKTFTRNEVWKNNYSLFLTDVQTSVNSAKLQNAAGGELITQSMLEKDEAKAKKMRTEAVLHLQKAIQLHPTYRNAYLLLGNGYNYLKDFDKSIQAYENGLKIDPTYADIQKNLGITCREAGKFNGENNNLSKAIPYLEKAYKLMPSDAETVRLLGVANGIGGNAPKALEWFSKCVELNPDNAHAVWDLGTAYQGVGNMARMQELHNQALQMNPNLMEEMKQPKK